MPTSVIRIVAAIALTMMHVKSVLIWSIKSGMMRTVVASANKVKIVQPVHIMMKTNANVYWCVLNRYLLNLNFYFLLNYYEILFYCLHIYCL